MKGEHDDPGRGGGVRGGGVSGRREGGGRRNCSGVRGNIYRLMTII